MEAGAIKQLASLLTDQFEETIIALANCKGRIVISGIGKSAVIAQKIVATLNSTGSPAIFLQSPELKILVPLIKNFGNILIAIAGNTSSYLAKKADFVVDTTVHQEACPNNLAPTTSTTAQLVIGDAIAICLMEQKGFNVADFAKLHPGGTLGKKLYLRVKDLYADNEKPNVYPENSLKEVIVEMTKKRLGVTVVTSSDETVLGVITDGDLRRMLEKNGLEFIHAKDIMTKNPKTIGPDEMAVNALDIMRQNEIVHLVVVENKKYLGIIHLHDLVKEGLL
jgi:arabinose-5-phosphate isomerase